MVIYLALFDSDENNEKIFDRIRYLIMLKSNFLGMYSHKYAKVKMNVRCWFTFTK